MIQPGEFHRLRILFRTFEVQLALIPAVAIAFWFDEKFTPLFWFFGLWIVSIVAVAILIGEWRCPACGKTYFRKSATERAWLCTVHCAHCGCRRPRLGFFH